MFRLADGYPDHFAHYIRSRNLALVDTAWGGEVFLGTLPFIRSIHHSSGRGCHCLMEVMEWGGMVFIRTVPVRNVQLLNVV